MDDDLIAFDDYWREVMQASEQGIWLDLSKACYLMVKQQPKNVRPAISGLLTEADGDHRVGRFK